MLRSALADCPTSATATWPGTCPIGDEGRVVVDLDYNFNVTAGSQYLGVDEIQCAVDCLDGDPDPDYKPSTLAPDGRWNVPLLTRGGTIDFLSTMTYAIYQPKSINLPVGVDSSVGSIVIRGNGAVIHLNTAYSYQEIPGGVNFGPTAMIRRVVPPTGNNCDADLLGNHGQNWSIENLTFKSYENPLILGGPITGIDMHSAHGFVVRNCTFDGVDVGISIQFSDRASIDNCQFFNCKRNDVILGDGSECASNNFFGPCWSACGSGDYPTYYSAMDVRGPQLRSPSVACRMEGNFHGPGGTTQTATIDVRDAPALVIASARFDGHLPQSFLKRHSGANGTTVLRDSWFWIHDLPSETYQDTPIVDNRGLGTMIIDNVEIQGGHVFVYDVSKSLHPTRLVLKEMPWFPGGGAGTGFVMRSRGADTSLNHQFSIVDVADTTWVATDPARWIDATGNPDAHGPPSSLTVRSFSQLVVPPPNETVVAIPALGGPGMLWHDRTSGEYKATPTAGPSVRVDTDTTPN